MDFDDETRLDASQVEDARGGRPRGGGMVIGGGAIGLIALIAALLFGIDPGQIVGGGSDAGDGGVAPQPTAENLATRCRTGADADQSEDCRIVGVVNSIQKYWDQEFTAGGLGYRPAPTRLFSGVTSTGCGTATSAVGPFYCPADKRVYLDLGFFQELQAQFGAEGGPFAQAYVIAHEYGHHVQDLLGTMNRLGGDRQGSSSASVRLELQADCYAGVWARHAVRTGYFDKPFTDKDIAQAIDAAGAVGDDRIQERTRGRVDPESFTHGSAEQRQHWFTTGYDSGDPMRCDTFAGRI
jgi:uncharacterized protein